MKKVAALNIPRNKKIDIGLNMPKTFVLGLVFYELLIWRGKKNLLFPEYIKWII